MIFSLTYGVVAPLPVFQENATVLAEISWREVSPGIWVLALDRPCVDLKGLNLKSDLPAGSVLALEAGSLCGEQSQPVFLANIDQNGLDVGLALLGEGAIFMGSGDLLRVKLAEGVTPGPVDLVLRSSANAVVDSDLEMTGTAEDMPAVYRLAGNYPNPFNPKTAIRFDLPAAQSVKLAVFDAEGRQVIMLVDAQLPAGFHEVSWDGRDATGAPVASGLYFYRIEAGPLQETAKMLLLK